MIRLDMPQGSLAWMEARLGIPTASNFDKLITPGGKPSSSAEKYAWKCVAEQILNHPIQEKEEASGFMERGTIMQKNARAFYELQRDVETEEVGFMLRDNRRAGCSPDLLVKGGISGGNNRSNKPFQKKFGGGGGQDEGGISAEKIAQIEKESCKCALEMNHGLMVEALKNFMFTNTNNAKAV